MISDAAIAAARAVPIAEVVGQHVELIRDFALCPFHDERTASLHIHRASNRFVCFGCGAKGDTIEFLRRIERLDFSTAVHKLTDSWQPSGTRPQLLPIPPNRALQETEVPFLVAELWRTADAPEMAEFYLESRGIAQKTLPEALRGHRCVWCREAGESRSAMLAALTDAAGRITAVQRTWVRQTLIYDGSTKFPKGARATDLSAPKKTIGSMGNGAVRLAAAGEVLGIAEGVESALAAAGLFRIPTWATCGLSRLGFPSHRDRHGHLIKERAPNIWIPPKVRQLVFFADNGEIGQRVADFACWWWRRQGVAAQAEYPSADYADFAEGVAQ